VNGTVTSQSFVYSVYFSVQESLNTMGWP